MIQDTNLGEPVYKLFLNASTRYVERVEELAAAVRRDEPLLAKLLQIIAVSTAQSVTVILQRWPDSGSGSTTSAVQSRAQPAPPDAQVSPDCANDDRGRR